MPTEWKPETNYRSNVRVKLNDQGKVLALLCLQPGRSGNAEGSAYGWSHHSRRVV
jgi:hypothetical protein